MERVNVILMAAGLGSRMRPITEKMPKPLVKVGDKALIETVIEAFSEHMSVEFYVVTGYLGKQFECLLAKYNHVNLIENMDFNVANNISSIFYARDILKRGECFICEADLLITDSTFLKEKPADSCYYGTFINGSFDDWGFEVDGAGFINRVKKGCADKFAMTGIAYFDQEHAAILADCIEESYRKGQSSHLFWDEIVDRNLDKLRMKIHEISRGQIIEIDTMEELEKVRAEYNKQLGENKHGR